MSPERYKQVCELFHAACELPESERAAYLDAQVNDDAELRAQVEEMLAQDAGEEDAVGNVALGFGRHLIDDIDAGANPVAAQLPESIGPFKILRKLGEGGMGVVYEATQTSPHRRVALKVLRARFATGTMLRRFQHEVEIQARLNHPGIGHVYEAGVETYAHGKQPYFSMELVSGRSITRYVREENSDVNDRLSLMIDVADAVQHAHDHGVVHRDLKPGNIVVQDNGKPKVLDFGIARVTNDDTYFSTIQTAAGQLLGTIPYMSPEQISGQGATIDHRSDIYSLGVLLYEMLADQLPFDLSTCSIPQAALIIKDDDPPRLSSINVAYRGEIETVVMKTLEKQPERRYQSASALAADLRHILLHEPVSVRPPSTAYQVRRFARRNKAVVGGVAATLLALVLGIVGISRYAYREYQQRSRAEQAQALAQAQTYRVSVAAAAHALDNQNVLAARRLLNEAPKAYRGWEWYYLQSKLDASSRLLTSKHLSVNNLAYFENGQTLLARSRQSYLLWNLKRGEIVEEIPGSVEVHAAVSPDLAYFAFVDQHGRSIVRDFKTGRDVELVNAPPNIHRFAISADHQFVAIGTKSGVLQIRRLGEDSVVNSIDFDRIETLSWSPTRNQLAVRTQTEFVIIDVNDAESITRLRRPSIVQSSIIEWNPNGSVVFLSDTRDDDREGEVFRFDVTTMRALSPLVGHSIRAESLKFYNNGEWVISSSRDGTARLWSAETGALFQTYRVAIGSAFSATVGGDGSLVAMGDSAGAVRLFDATSGRLLTTLPGHESPVLSIAISPDEKQIAAGAADGAIRFWSVEAALQSDVLRGHESYIYPVTVGPDNKRVASASWDGTIRIWDIASGKNERVIDGHDMPPYFLAFNDAGDKLVSYGHLSRNKNELIVDDLDASKQYRLTGERQRPGMAPAFHSDDQRVWLPRGPGGMARFWSFEANTIDDVPISELANVQSPLIHSKSRRVLLIDNEAQTAFVVDLTTGEVVHELIDYAMAARWSPDGTQVVVIHRSNRDETSGDRISVWNAITGEFRGHLMAHVGDVFDACFSPDGSRIFTAGRDEQIRIWDAQTLSHLIALNGHTEYVWSLAFDSSGELLVSGSGDRTVRLWRAPMLDYSAP